MLEINGELHLAPVLNRLVNAELVVSLFYSALFPTALAFGYLLLRRFGAARAEQERLHTELETARQVQLLMLPSQSVAIPHLRVETVYLPAHEVGGDFFQIARTEEDALFLVMGDVSGKGLQAALTVSLVVGLWKEMSARVSSPSEILTYLNRQVAGSMKGGFVTCCALGSSPTVN